MTQPPNQPYDPNQAYNPQSQQPYTPGQPYDPNQAQQPYNPGQPYDPNQPQQPYMAQGGFDQPKKKNNNAAAVIKVIVAAVFLGLGAWGLWSQFQSSQALQVGKCIVVSGTADKADHKEVDCSDKTQFSFEVAKTVDNSDACPSDMVSYEVTNRSGRSTKTQKVACLIRNLHQGVCYKVDSSNQTAPLAVTECGSADVKVTKRVDQANASCESDELPLSYDTPARTYCLAPASDS